MAETTTDKQFQRIHLFIGEGQIEEALAALERIQPESSKEQQEVAYLRAWCCTERNAWDEAAKFLLSAGVNKESISDIQAQGQTERRRKAYYQLLMGDIATNIGHYEEGMSHYRLCLRFLDERRMNIPALRMRVLIAMGTLSIITGLYDMALSYYENALRLCGGDDRHASLPDIYYGLCDTYRQKGKFPEALEYGKRALNLYSESDQQNMVGRMRNLLGRICYQMRDFQMANSYYTEALALATLENSPIMSLNNLVALADLRCAEGELGEARRYCEMALNYATRLPPGTNHYRGMMYIVCGKVEETAATAVSDQRARELLEKAIDFYEQAVQTLQTTDAKVVLGEAYQRLAQVLETSGKQDRAMAYWKSAYSVASNSRGASTSIQGVPLF